MKTTFTERNGILYAYECTSHRVPGKKNPVSERRYLGKVDNATGKIIPPNTDGPRFLCDCTTRCMDYGDSTALLSIADDIGLVDDLRAIFPKIYREILAICVSEAIRPSPIDVVTKHLRITGTCELLGIPHPSSKSITSVLSDVNHESNQKFVELRVHRNNGGHTLYHIGKPITLDERPNSTAMSRMDLIMGLDSNGLPMLITANDEELSNPHILLETVDLCMDDNSPVLLSNSHDINLGGLADLISHHPRFAVSVHHPSELMTIILPRFEGLESKTNMTVYKGMRCYVRHIPMSLTGSPNGWKLEDTEWDDHGSRLDVWVCYNRTHAERIRNNLLQYLEGIVKELNNRSFDRPQQSFEAISGNMSVFIDRSVGPDGVMHISMNKRRIGDFVRLQSSFAVIGRGLSWDEIMSSRSGAVRVKKEMDRIDAGLWAVKSKGVSNIHGLLLVDLITVMLRTELQRRLDESGSEISVDEALYVASSWKIMCIDGKLIRGFAEREVSRIFRLLDIDDIKFPPEEYQN